MVITIIVRYRIYGFKGVVIMELKEIVQAIFQYGGTVIMAKGDEG